MKKIIFAMVIAASYFAYADDNQEATKKTQALLRDKTRREKEVINQDAKAKQTDQQLDVITDGDAASKDEMYDISAELMPWIVEQSGGDTAKMNTMMERALKNPEKFLASMPEAERNRIHGLSKKLEKSKIKP